MEPMSCRPSNVASLLLALCIVGCDGQMAEQSKRDAANREALAEFEREQADGTLSNWDEPRLMAALGSADPSDRANAARELGQRKAASARGALLDVMRRDGNSVVVSRAQGALLAIGDPDDIVAIRDYAIPRAATLDGEFLLNLHVLDDPWVETLLQDAWDKAPDNARREQVVGAQTLRRDRMTQ
jgi:hypothetical protein